MGTTSTNGYQLPATGDRDWWTQLYENWERVDAHNHDGTDSELLSPTAITKEEQSVLAASWAAVAGQAGTYKQTLTVPTGMAVNTMFVKFYINGGGDDGQQIYPSIRKVTSTTFDVYINDSSLALKAIYG